MKDRLKRQEQSKELQALRRALHSMEVRDKEIHEWQLMANELFSSLDSAEAAASSRRTRMRAAPLFRPAYAAVAALLLIAIGITAFFAVGLRQEQTIPITVANSTGSVLMVNNDLKQSDQIAEYKTSLLRHATVITQTNSCAALQFDRHSGIFVSPQTKMSIQKSTVKTRRLQLLHGEVLVSLKKRQKGQQFAVVTRNAECRVVGTVFRVRADSVSGRTDLTVYRGKVAFVPKSGSRAPLYIEAGQAASIGRDDAPQKYASRDSAPPIRELSYLTLALDAASDSAGHFGLVEFTSEPSGATVLMNGRIVGKTPMFAKSGAGFYEIAYESDGYRRETKVITVEPGKTQLAHSSLKQTPAKPTAKVPPKNAHPVTKKLTKENPETEDAVINHPEYVEALIQMTVGEYRKALAALDSLKNRPEVTPRERARAVEKIAACYQSMGDFKRALATLEKKLDTAEALAEQSAALWEIANLQATCLADYGAAEENLQAYIQEYPDGAWIHHVYLKLAEVEYMLGKPHNAAKTYATYLKEFAAGDNRDQAMHHLAQIQHYDLDNRKLAAQWRETLTEHYPQNAYAEQALYSLAGDYQYLGMPKKAQQTKARFIQQYSEDRWSYLAER